MNTSVINREIIDALKVALLNGKTEAFLLDVLQTDTQPGLPLNDPDAKEHLRIARDEIAAEKTIDEQAELVANVNPVVEACARGGSESVKANESLTFFENIALPLIERGWRVAPCIEKSKTVDGRLVPDPLNQRSNDPRQIHEWGVRSPNANVCVYAVQEPGGMLFLDKDGAISIVKKYESETGKAFPKTLLVQSSIILDANGGMISKGHFYFLQTPRTISMVKNITEGETGGLFSLRLKNFYVASIGSIHPVTGLPYVIADDQPVIPMPDDFLDWLIGCANQCSPIGNWAEEKAEDWLSNPFIHHNIDNQIVRFIGHYIGRTTGSITNPKEMFRLITGHIEENGCYEQDGKTAFECNLDRVKELCETKCREWESGESKKAKATIQISPSVPSLIDPAPSVNEEPEQEFAMTPEQVEAEYEKEYPVIPLTEQAGPVWSDDIMYGLAGDIIRKASVYCEAHPAGMYLDLLIGFGNIIGRSAYFNVNQTKHYTNEFMARVGLTSFSRKGTGRDVVDEILKMADFTWFLGRIKSGFGSAESVINEIRDSSQQQIKNRKNLFDAVEVPGVADKRLCIREGELASIFQQVAKKDSRTDIVLRDGWDGKSLHNLVKGRGNDGLSNSNSCREPHISISGDTTVHELKAKMPSGAAENGFGNRFLYCYVYQTKLCPRGGPQIDWSAEIPKLHHAVETARERGVVGLQKSAWAIFDRLYVEMSRGANRLPGLAGLMTARGPAHIRRLALILALLDECDVVETWHLQAARKIWDYCESSAKFIFTNTTAEQDRIIEYVRKEPAGVTLGQIRREVFHDHKKSEWVKTQVSYLVQKGYGGITRKGDKLVAGPK